MESNIYDELSEEEQVILKMSEEKKSNREIARSLNITYARVNYLKLSMRNRGIFVPKNVGYFFTDEKRQLIIKLDKAGYTTPDISRIMEVKQSNVSHWKRIMKEEGYVFISTGGRPSGKNIPLAQD